MKKDIKQFFKKEVKDILESENSYIFVFDFDGDLKGLEFSKENLYINDLEIVD